jgi:hypothetical protein
MSDIAAAKQLANLLADYHAEQLNHAFPNEKLLNAFVVKTVALIALAFDVPPIDDDNYVDIDDTVARLQSALHTIKEFKN